MTPKKPHRRYYRTLCAILVGSFILAEAAIVAAHHLLDPLPGVSRDNQALMILLLLPLGVILILLLERVLSASNAAVDPTLVHQALTPERIYILGCGLFTIASVFTAAGEFDSTIWGLLLSATIVGPLVSYAQHFGELRRALKSDPQTLHDITSLRSKLIDALAENSALRAHLVAVHEATLWERVRRKFGGFWRSLQQEVFDQFDRLLKP